jgi:ATP-dependent Clp protease ATP-binding subunit ClpC
MIIDIELKKLFKRIEGLGYQLKLSKKAKDFIAEKGFDKQFGARPLKRAIQKYIEDSLAEQIVNANLVSGDTISLDRDANDDDKLKVTIKKAEESSEAS